MPDAFPVIEKTLPNEFTPMRYRLLTSRKLLLPIMTAVALLALHGAFPDGWPAMVLAFVAYLLLPGWMLSGLLLDLPVWQRLPAAFSFSIGLLGLLVVVLLRLQTGLQALAWSASVIIVLLAVYALAKQRAPRNLPHSDAGPLPIPLLLLALLSVAAAILYWAYRAPISDAGDHWFYLQYIRYFLDHGMTVDVNPLASQTASAGTIMRASLNGWWALQAAAIRASGMDLLEAYWYAFPPLLMALSLLAVYGLAQQLFKQHPAALFTVLFQVLFLFASIGSHSWPGNGFFLRISEDKYLVMFVLLPAALTLFLRTLEDFRPKKLAALGVSLLAIGLAHPFGIFQWSAAAGGTLLAKFLAHRMSGDMKSPWVIASGIALLLVFALALQPWVQVPFDTSQGQELPYTSQTIVLDAGRGSFVSNPHVIAHPLVLLAIGLSLPLWIWFAHERPAQFILGATWLPLLFAFHPTFAALLGRLGDPWLVWRITWVLPTAMALAYAAGKIELVFSGKTTNRRSFTGWASLTTLVLCASLMHAYLLDSAGLMRDQKYRHVTADEISVLEAIRGAVAKEEVVLAPPELNNHLPAFSSRSQLLSFRIFQARPGALEDLVWFYSQGEMSPELLEFLRKWGVGKVVLPRDHQLAAEWRSLTDHFVLYHESEAYALFEVRSLPADWEPATSAQVPRRLVGTTNLLPNPAENDLQAAHTLRNAGSLDLALTVYGRVLAREPEIFGLVSADGIWGAWGRSLIFDRRADRIGEALLGIGEIYEQRGQWERAESSYQRLIALAPDREVGYAALARVLQRSGRADKIPPLFRRAAQTYFWLTWPQVQLSDAYLALGQTDEAARALNAALRLDPDNVFTLVRLARVYRVERDLETALSYGLQALGRAFSTHEIAQANYELGQIYWALGNNEHALEHFLLPAEVLPDYPVHHATIGDFYLLAERDPLAALPYYLTATSLAPDNAAYQLTLGDIYRDLGDDENAGRAYTAASLLSPDLSGLQERLRESP